MVSASDRWFEVVPLMSFLALALLQSPARCPTPSLALSHSLFVFLLPLGSSLKYLTQQDEMW